MNHTIFVMVASPSAGATFSLFHFVGLCQAKASWTPVCLHPASLAPAADAYVQVIPSKTQRPQSTLS